MDAASLQRRLERAVVELHNLSEERASLTARLKEVVSAIEHMRGAIILLNQLLKELTPPDEDRG